LISTSSGKRSKNASFLRAFIFSLRFYRLVLDIGYPSFETIATLEIFEIRLDRVNGSQHANTASLSRRSDHHGLRQLLPVAKVFQPKTDEELLASVRDNILSTRIEQVDVFTGLQRLSH
jgi:hypothetical protein